MTKINTEGKTVGESHVSYVRSSRCYDVSIREYIYTIGQQTTALYP